VKAAFIQTEISIFINGTAMAQRLIWPAAMTMIAVSLLLLLRQRQKSIHSSFTFNHSRSQRLDPVALIVVCRNAHWMVKITIQMSSECLPQANGTTAKDGAMTSSSSRWCWCLYSCNRSTQEKKATMDETACICMT
jgi:hypothetical protein